MQVHLQGVVIALIASLVKLEGDECDGTETDGEDHPADERRCRPVTGTRSWRWSRGYCCSCSWRGCSKRIIK